MTVDDFVAEIRDKKPTAAAADVAAFEDAIGHALPDDYRQFLIACNGGHVGGRLWFDGPTPDGGEGDAGVHHIGGFRDEPYFSLEHARQVYEGRIPKDLLWIMDDPFGNAICIGLNGSHRGLVYFWSHESEPDDEDWNGGVETAGNVHLLATSFTEFVAGLRPLKSEEPPVEQKRRPWWKLWKLAH